MLTKVYFYFLSNNFVVSYQYFLIVFFPLVLQGLMRPYKQVCIFTRWHIHCLQATDDAQLTRYVDPIIE